MKTFKILNNTVSFDEGLSDYIEIMQDAQSYKVNFDDKYWATPPRAIITVEDFMTYIQEIEPFFQNEFVKIAEELVKFYIKHEIYDVSKDWIVMKNATSLNKHNENMQPIYDYIEDFTIQIQQSISEIKSSWNNAVNNAITGHYFNVYSPYYSDILLNDYFNHKEEKRVEKTRQQLYAKNVNEALRDYSKQVIDTCQKIQIKIQETLYEDIIEMIEDMYNNCAIDLFAREKISSFSQYADSYKSRALLDNIDKITSKKVVEEQLVNLLQKDSFNLDIHSKIIEYIAYNDIPEYIEIIKFLQWQNAIFSIYLGEYLKGNDGNKEFNDKCLNILKAMTDIFDIETLLKGTFSSVSNYTDDVFLNNIRLTKRYFECLKEIFGADNKIINEKEQNMFITAIKEVSKGTNLTYDGSISRLDYNHLCEFWDKARKQRNTTIKMQEITQDISNSFANWIKNHIKGIIIFIIIVVIFYFASKDSDNTETNNYQVPEAWQNTQIIDNKKDDTDYIPIPNIDNDDYPKSNPFAT